MVRNFFLLVAGSLLVIALLSMVACAEPESANPDFPQLRRLGPGDPESLNAEAVGELISDNGCLRLRDIDVGDNYLLIWPHTAEMTPDGQGVRVRDNSGASLSFSVGDEIWMGGGETSFSHVRKRVRQPIPSDCPGPYWLVGETVTSLQ